MDVMMDSFPINTRCQILGDEMVIDRMGGILDDIESSIMNQTPLRNNLTKLVDSVLLYQTNRGNDGPQQFQDHLLRKDELPSLGNFIHEHAGQSSLIEASLQTDGFCKCSWLEGQ
jgi:hypothetical protein